MTFNILPRLVEALCEFLLLSPFWIAEKLEYPWLRLYSKVRAYLGRPWDREAMADVYRWNKIVRAAREIARRRS